MLTGAVCALAAAAGPTASGVPASGALASRSCGAVAARSTVTQFLAAFNQGRPQILERVFARRDGGFQWYAVTADPGLRIGGASQSRTTLLRYFATRHRHAERLTLRAFSYVGYSLGKAQFTFDLTRTADDLASPAPYSGKGAITCWGRGGISIWAMGPKA
jgi:hypothetical protein